MGFILTGWGGSIAQRSSFIMLAGVKIFLLPATLFFSLFSLWFIVNSFNVKLSKITTKKNSKEKTKISLNQSLKQVRFNFFSLNFVPFLSSSHRLCKVILNLVTPSWPPLS